MVISTIQPSASPATAVTAGPGSNTSSPTDLPSPRHTSTPIQTPAHLDHSTVITNPTAVQSIGDALSTSDSGTGRVSTLQLAFPTSLNFIKLLLIHSPTLLSYTMNICVNLCYHGYFGCTSQEASINMLLYVRC